MSIKKFATGFDAGSDANFLVDTTDSGVVRPGAQPRAGWAGWNAERPVPPEWNGPFEV
ncbi:hypothetical protein ACTMS2_11665 [Micromonospora sp. SD12]|uniref:hypothetical protein n=1 Tax=Micromonospora sp. SD12 TaxID=3452216 RepID=UPI003F8A5895